jgi:uncharacterized protein
MKLDVSGSELIAAPRQRVYERLLDLHFVSRSTPGVKSIEDIDPTHFRVTSGFGVGPLKLKFTLAIELFDIVEGQSASMRLQGKATGSAIDMVSKVRVLDAGPGRTTLEWWAGGDVRGTAAGVAGRGMKTVARQFTTHFWQSFGRRVSQEG